MKSIRRDYHNTSFQMVGCGDLAALTDGTQSLTTWELDDKERETIAQGGAICLIVQGGGQPPVCLMTEDEAVKMGSHEPINDTRH